MIQDHSGHGTSKEPLESVTRVDSSVPLMYHDLSDLGSQILIQITPRERTPSVYGIKFFAENVWLSGLLF